MLSWSNAKAALITWTLTGVTFDDGGMASGSFQFDSTGPYSGIFSDINIVTFGGSTVGATYNTLFPGCANGPTFLCLVPASQTDLDGSSFLGFSMDPSLTDGGGSSSLFGNEGVCASPSCDSTTPARFVSGGTVTESTESTVPEPSGLTLILLGALLTAFWARWPAAPGRVFLFRQPINRNSLNLSNADLDRTHTRLEK